MIGPTAPGQTGRRLRRNAPRLLALAGVVLFLGLLAYGVTTEGESTRVDESLASGQAPLAPSFDLPILESGAPPAPLNRKLEAAFADGQLALSELDGTPFVLNFWASWCIPCREEARTLEQGWERLGPKGILILGLNMQDLTEDARGFLEEFGITYPTIREPGNETARAYGATGIPETYFVSPEGRVVGHAIGVVSRRQLADGALSAKRGEVVGTVAGGASWPQR